MQRMRDFIVCALCARRHEVSWQAPYTLSTHNAARTIATDGCYPLLISPHYQKIPRVLNNMATAYWIIKISILPCSRRAPDPRTKSPLHRIHTKMYIGVVLYLNFGLGPGSFPVIGQVRKQLLHLRRVSLPTLVPLKSLPVLCALPTNTTGSRYTERALNYFYWL